MKAFGAKPLQGFGLQGSSYAIPTCVRLWKLNKYNEPIVKITEPLANVEQIKPFVKAFINDAIVNSKLTFYVTKIGCGIAGFKVSEIAELFRPCLYMDNVILPEEFVKWLIYPVVIANVSERRWVSGKDYDDDTLMYYVMENIERKSIDDILDEFEKL